MCGLPTDRARVFIIRIMNKRLSGRLRRGALLVNMGAFWRETGRRRVMRTGAFGTNRPWLWHQPRNKKDKKDTKPSGGIGAATTSLNRMSTEMSMNMINIFKMCKFVIWKTTTRAVNSLKRINHGSFLSSMLHVCYNTAINATNLIDVDHHHALFQKNSMLWHHRG
jgi:hypothetical protein